MSKQLEQFQKAFAAYSRYNRRELGPLIENRGRRVQWELFRQFRAIAPSREDIDREAEALGFAIKRRTGKSGKAVSVKRELAARKRSLRWLSVSFLIRGWRARREGQSSAYAALSRRKREIGKAIIRTAKGKRRPQVRILSFLEGAAEQNRQRGIVDKALAAQTADMERYIARKQRERFEQGLHKTFSHLIGS
jgi:hypothetical protein